MGLDEGWLSRVQSAGLVATDRDTQIHVERSQLTEGLYSRAYIYSVCIYVYIYIYSKFQILLLSAYSVYLHGGYRDSPDFEAGDYQSIRLDQSFQHSTTPYIRST